MRHVSTFLLVFLLLMVLFVAAGLAIFDRPMHQPIQTVPAHPTGTVVTAMQ